MSDWGAGDDGEVAARTERVRALFGELCELPVRDQMRCLRERCAGDRELFAEVASLLRFDAAGGELAEDTQVQRGEPGERPSLGEPSETDDVPVIEGFEIEARLGAGSMGFVYSARQAHPARRVALKVVASSAPGLARRFDNEIAILARLQHPGIAQIYSAGTTRAAGARRPYFAMELVEGRPLDAFCNERQLGAHERVALFEKVVAAVGYAHEKHVVHCDLKPENVLVTADGSPKVLDFGIARAIDVDLFATRTGGSELAGTLLYMSPEQLVGSGGPPDPRSDIYSLGVLLYGLLAGRPVFELGSRNVAQTIEYLARAQPVPLGRIAAELRGDLETIVERALARDPAQRYASAADLCEDLARWRRGDAILARPFASWRRAAAFLVRHRVELTGLALAALGLGLAVFGRSVPAFAALAIGLVGATFGMLRARQGLVALERERAAAERQRERAERTSATLLSILSSADPGVSGPDTRVAELLERASLQLGLGLAEHPDVEGALRHTLGASYRALGLPERARAEFDRAFELRRRAHGLRHPDTLETLGWQALILRESGATQEALELQRQVVRLRDEVLGVEARQALIAHGHLGLALKRAGSWAEAEAELVRAVEGLRASGGADEPDTAIAETMLAGLYLERSRYAEAEKLLQNALASYARSHGDEHPETLKLRSNLAQALMRQGKLEAAEALYRPLVDAHVRVFGEEHWASYLALHNLGQCLAEAERLDEAEERLERASAGLARSLGEHHLIALLARNNFAELLRRTGRQAAAQGLLAELSKQAAVVLPASDVRRWDIERNWGRCLAELGDFALAGRHLRRALRGYERSGAPTERTRSVRALLAALEEQLAARRDSSGES